MTATLNLVLHHALSPLCGRAGLALGLPGLAWRSVDVAPPPLPNDGYPRIPVRQVAANVPKFVVRPSIAESSDLNLPFPRSGTEVKTA